VLRSVKVLLNEEGALPPNPLKGALEGLHTHTLAPNPWAPNPLKGALGGLPPKTHWRISDCY